MQQEHHTLTSRRAVAPAHGAELDRRAAPPQPRPERRHQAVGRLAAGLACWLLALASFFYLVGASPRRTSQAKGLQVEEVTPGTALAQAGILVGDVILAWERHPPGLWSNRSRGSFDSWIDWWWVEKELSPRGSMTLIGERNSIAKRWPIPAGQWLARITPRWTGDEGDRYHEGLEELRAGRIGRGTELWQQLASSVAAAGNPSRAWWIAREVSRHLKDVGEYERAAAVLQTALSYASGKQAEAVLLEDLGLVWRKAGDLDLAATNHREALQIRRKTRDGMAAAASLSHLAGIHFLQARLEMAMDLWQEELAIYRRIAPHGQPMVNALANLANMSFLQGDLDQVEALVDEAFAIQEGILHDGWTYAALLTIRARLHKHHGELDAAVRDYEGALGPLAVKSPIQAASVLNNLGIIVSEQGQLQRAEAYFERSLEITQQYPSQTVRAAGTQANLAAVAADMGQLDRAEKLYREALSVYLAQDPDSPKVTATISNLGAVQWMRGNYTLARDSFEKARARRLDQDPNGLGMASTLSNLGLALKELGQAEQAIDHHYQALEILRRLAPESIEVAHALNNLGAANLAAGFFETAEATAGQALEMHAEKASGSFFEADSANLLGRAQQAQGRNVVAREAFSRAVEALESQINRLGGSEHLRSAFRAKHASIYRDYVDSLLLDGKTEEAFAVLERYRARSFRALAAERGGILAQKVPPELEAQLGRLRFLYNRESRELLSSPGQDERYLELARLQAEYEELMAEVRRSGPERADLGETVTLDTAAAREVLDPGTVLLSYVVGRHRTWVFLLSADDELQVEKIELGEKALGAYVDGWRELLRWPAGQREGESEDRARLLYDRLIHPVEQRLAAADRLALIADGPLHLLPWGALRRGEGGGSQYLVEWKPFHLLPSLTVFAKLAGQRDPSAVYDLELVAFGNPLTASIEERLPATEQEVRRIADLYPNHQIYLGDRATEAAVKGLGGRVRFLHFATHGRYDARRPLDSALMLSWHEGAAPGEENGLLQAWEVFEQLRVQADTVVLSACDSAVGEGVGGEGLQSLTRAFLYAGARSVAASLWKVEDGSTAVLMQLFYDYLEKGLTKDAALRAAQLGLIRGRGHGAMRPYSWAAFEVFGDWR